MDDDFERTHDALGRPIGYHVNVIPKGELGEISKIVEEFKEFVDAHDQKNVVMELVELTDLLGAIEAYSKNRYNIDLLQLYEMTKATRRAFESGHRK